jgi:D-glycero-alpha-D-manno-heptose-7-phosphate kinase
LRLCLQAIEANSHGYIFLKHDDQRVVGLLTDGDIRRALIAGATLDEPALKYANRDFRYIDNNESRELLLKSFDSFIKFMPVLKDGRLQKVLSLSDLAYVERESVTARAKAPARISFGGGGTDLTVFFSSHGGAVLNATINRYAHASLTKKSGSEITIKSRDYNLNKNYASLADLKYDGSLDLVKAAIKLLHPDFGFELELRCDFPPGSGLGGSSVVLAAIIGCFNEFRRDKLNLHDIAELSFQCERLELKNPGGWQDQYASVFGGLNFMEFRYNQNEISPLRLPKDILFELEERLLLAYTGKSHLAGAIHKKQKLRMMNDEQVIEFGKKTQALAYEMKSALLRGNIDLFGEMIHAGWDMKKSFADGISDPELDSIYDNALKNGALGGKILGTGGGGYFLFLAGRDSRHQLSTALQEMQLETHPVSIVDQGIVSWIVPAVNFNK